MSTFFLDVFNQGQKAAILTIHASNGTNSSGFFWEWSGMGMLTQGKWEWMYVGKFFIGLRNKDGDFGFVHSSWSRGQNKNGFPFPPWFSLLALSAGTVELQVLNLQTFNWALK
ncbi:MAG: hypothetical protein WBD27_20060 [Pyrinomonadaceae bacterium]